MLALTMTPKLGLSQDNLVLNGLSSLWQLNREYYVGALYLTSHAKDPEAVLNMAGPKRMEIKVTIDKWSPRRFSQMWNQAILINNSADEQKRLSKDIVSFVNLPKEDLIYGDKITIALIPGKGTDVSLNDVKFMSSSEEGFFNLLANTWIGARPPSSDFKHDVLNQPVNTEEAQDLASRYEVIIPPDGRAKEVVSWAPEKYRKAALAALSAAGSAVSALTPSMSSSNAAAEAKAKKEAARKAAEAKKIAEKKAAEEKKRLAEKKAREAKELAARQEAERKAAEAKALAEKQAAEAKSLAEKQAAEKKAAEAKKLAEKVAAEKKAAEAKRLAEQKAAEEAKKLAEKKAAEEAAKAAKLAAAKKAEANKVSDAKLQGVLNIYRANMLRLTYRHVVYPSRSLSLNQEGTVVLKVTVDRKGKVVNISEETKSQFVTLNKAAEKAVKKASPYPEVPKLLPGEKFEFKIPIKFRIPT